MKLLKDLALAYLEALVRFYKVWGYATRTQVYGFLAGTVVTTAALIAEEATTAYTRTEGGVHFVTALIFLHGAAGLSLVVRRLRDIGYPPWHIYYLKIPSNAIMALPKLLFFPSAPRPPGHEDD